jgi:acetylornithine/succinyldiaminopimelate/putrescine aminotransferase
MTEINAPEMARTKGQALTKQLLALPGVESVRGWGLLLGVEINHEGLAGRTGPEIAAACLKAGLIVNGITPTALRLAPPITITDQEITQGVALLADVLNNPEIAA